ncbi:MAG: DUF4238 domain-containing protein [Chlorobaculum sp.]|nr:DUF4238 domain-containing protein [Chlorobaculum sp.]
MATNKNQHFVPRCYLKEFTHRSEGTTINLFNIDRKKTISNAPVKNQCSKDYFYGKDEFLENVIQLLEGTYASTLQQLLSSLSPALNNNQIFILKRFLLFQYLRTEAASKLTVEISASMNEVTGNSGYYFNLEIKKAVLMAMRDYVTNIKIIDDLKICIVQNKTDIPFITSDDPVVLSNKWHLNDIRTKLRSFGLRTCGALLFLPITPKLMCLAYDGDVYHIAHKNCWTSILDINDVIAFNEQQILNCRANLFFKDIDHHSFVEKSFNETSANRPQIRHRLHYAVLDMTMGDYSRYKVVDPKTVGEHKEAIINIETIHAHPSSWPSIIGWKKRGTVYTNGSALGYIRKYHILSEHKGFYKESIIPQKR